MKTTFCGGRWDGTEVLWDSWDEIETGWSLLEMEMRHAGRAESCWND